VRSHILRDDPAGYAASCAAVAGVASQDRPSRIARATLVISGANMEIIANASHLSVLETPAEFDAPLRAFF
jgi:hypothetical protein